MLLSEFLERVYIPIRLLGRSQRTHTLYRHSIRLFSDSLGRPATTADLTDETVGGHLARMIADGHAPGGVNKERSQLLAIWNLAARKRHVPDFPEIRPIPVPERIPFAWTREQLWKLRMSCSFARGNYAGVPARLWWNALHLFAYATGERIAAIIQVRWADLGESVVVFPATIRKGSKRANVCQLPQYAMDALNEIRNPNRDLIFPWSMSETYLYKHYSSILQRAELPDNRDTKFHALRRTHATHLKLAGGDPGISLGHSNPAVTARYIDPRQMPTNAAARLPEFPKEVG